MQNPDLLNYVHTELQSRKGDWPAIAKAIKPESWESYYSWLTKFARGKIPGASFNRVQQLAEHFHHNPRG